MKNMDVKGFFSAENISIETLSWSVSERQRAVTQFPLLCRIINSADKNILPNKLIQRENCKLMKSKQLTRSVTDIARV